MYPPEISLILNDLSHSRRRNGNCVGTEANFSCGSVVRVRLDIDAGNAVRDASFSSNGCGWMVAAAQTLCAFLAGKKLADLHGLADDKLLAAFDSIQIERPACVAAAISAAKAAFSNFRSQQIKEFRGEKALICTCFSVTEERIAAIIHEKSFTTAAQVGEATNAGTGCGSCRMLIEEMLDGR